VSQYIDTQQTSYGGSTGLSTPQRWEIAVGIIIAAALAIAAFAYVNRTESPVAEPVAQPAAQSYAGVDDLATSTAVPAQSHAGVDDLATRSAVPAQSYAGVDDLATRFTVSEAIRYAGADDLATRFTVSEAIRYAGVDDLATRSSVVGASGIVEQSVLDAFELRSGAVSPAVVGTTGPRYAGSDDLATR